MGGIKVAVLGATRAVGREMLKVLAERNFPVSVTHFHFGSVEINLERVPLRMLCR